MLLEIEREREGIETEFLAATEWADEDRCQEPRAADHRLVNDRQGCLGRGHGPQIPPRACHRMLVFSSGAELLPFYFITIIDRLEVIKVKNVMARVRMPMNRLIQIGESRADCR